MVLNWKLHEDGSFDLASERLSLLHCYPAKDGVPVRPIAVELERTSDGGTARYTLADGTILLTFGHNDDSATLGAEIIGMPTAPHEVSAIGDALIVGACRVFRQAVAFGQPSGFIDLPVKETLESYAVTALLTSDKTTLTIAANDHSRFTQRCRLTADPDNCQTTRLDAAFLTECITLIDGSLELPTLHFTLSEDPWTGLRQTAADIGSGMKARTHQPTSYHWCSCYYLYQYQTEDDLDEYLAGFNSISPKIPFQTIQLDAGYFPSTGDWLDGCHRFPSGMQKVFEKINRAGYRPGIWVAPIMVGNRSRLAAEHPEWLLRNLDGTPIVAWHSYGERRLWGYRDEEIYKLDTSHPEAMEYIRTVFRTLHEWGAQYFKTDLLVWGFCDSTTVKRHTPGKTSVEYVRDLMRVIREAIGEDSFLLACYAPFAHCVGYADSMFMAGDVDPPIWDASHDSHNMITDTYVLQYFNNIWYQNDPDIIFVRDFHIEYTETEIHSLALWKGILGGTISTSDLLHKIAPERLDLWRFLQPGNAKWTARFPCYGEKRDLLVAVRDFENAPGSAVLVFNPGEHRMMESLMMSDLVGEEEAFVYEWGPSRIVPIGKQSLLAPIVDPHESVLYHVSRKEIPPPPHLTLGGALT